jgi:hypothetical protein
MAPSANLTFGFFHIQILVKKIHKFFIFTGKLSGIKHHNPNPKLALQKF